MGGERSLTFNNGILETVTLSVLQSSPIYPSGHAQYGSLSVVRQVPVMHGLGSQADVSKYKYHHNYTTN